VQQPHSTYRQVVWLVKNTKVGEAVLRAMNQTLDKRFKANFKVSVLPPIALAGVAYPEREAKLTPEQKAARLARLTAPRYEKEKAGGPLTA
jgi:hypothetical protein